MLKAETGKKQGWYPTEREMAEAVKERYFPGGFGEALVSSKNS